ncbi:MAG: universal stress protein [Thermoleophilaceae bacterium]|nr:universal stress protein [Thermoleophilaceae bacterium]
MSDDTRPVVVGHDDDPTTADALALGTALAAAIGAPLVLARVVPEDDDDSAAAAAEGLAAVPGEHEARVVRAASPAAGLYELAEELRPEVVVVGSHRRGTVGRLLAGSVGERLVQGAPCPVAVPPRGYSEAGPAELRVVCVGFDGEPESWSALQHGARVAAAAGARLRIVCAAQPPTPWPTATPLLQEIVAEQRAAAERRVAQAVASVSERLEPEGRTPDLEPLPALEAESKGDVDLLVLGSRGYGPLHRVLTGSVSAPLLRSAACPVIVVPRSVEFDPGATGLAGSDELS